MSDKVLFVDDEPNILNGIRRQLRRRFEITTATSGEEGLQVLQDEGPFPVVVSDMRMPGMNGGQFLAHVRERSPDTVRLILSGQADLESTVEVVNEVNIFRFLLKPCATEVLTQGLESALAQHRLIEVEKELLENTLSGAVKVLTEVLSLVNPEAFSRTSRVQHYVEGITEHLDLPNRWELRLAAMLSQIGCVTLPQDTLARFDAGQELSDHERQMLDEHPDVAGKLLSSIPRLEPVAAIVSGQMETTDPAELPEDPSDWEGSVLGAQILRAAIELDRWVTRGQDREDALEQLKRIGVSPLVVGAVEQVPCAKNRMVAKTVRASEVRISMVLDEDVMTCSGMRLIPKGQEVTAPILVRLRNFANGAGIVEPFRVMVLT